MARALKSQETQHIRYLEDDCGAGTKRVDSAVSRGKNDVQRFLLFSIPHNTEHLLQRTLRVKQRFSFLNIMTGSDLSVRRLPRMTLKSGVPGPIVWLTACGHGDEVCGVAIIHDVFRKLRRSLLRGEIHAFPLMNPLGFETASRTISVTREDLNRSFPGDPHGSLGERLAHRIFDTIIQTGPDLVLDLHNDWIRSIPYALIDPAPDSDAGRAYADTATLAKHSGLVSIIDTDELNGTLSYTCLSRGIPALTLELGEPRVINETNVAFGVGAITNILAALDMIAPSAEPFRYPLPHRYSGILLRYSDRPYCSRSGIIRFLAEPGTEVRGGQPIARIINAFGKHQETVRALAPAILLGHSDSSVSFPGMPLMAFGCRPDMAP